MNENQKNEIIGFFTGKDVAFAFKGTVFVFDQIPEKKLQNAIKHYAPVKNGEEVVLLYEYSAKEGFVLTTTNLYVNQPTYTECSVNESAVLSDITDFARIKGKGFMNPDEFIKVFAGSKYLVIKYIYGKQLMEALEKTVSVIKSSGLPGDSGSSAQQVMQETATSPGLKHEYEQGQEEGEELADKLMDVADKAKNALGKISGLFGKK